MTKQALIERIKSLFLPRRFAVYVCGTIETNEPVTFGPFTHCRMRGASFNETMIGLVRSWTVMGAFRKASSCLPRGLEVQRLVRLAATAGKD